MRSMSVVPWAKQLMLGPDGPHGQPVSQASDRADFPLLKSGKTVPNIMIAKAFQRLGHTGAGGCPALSDPCCSLEDMAMRSAFDFSPLYRSTVGFDRLFDMLDQAVDVEPMPSWPSYNVEKVGEDRYRVVIDRKSTRLNSSH